MRSNRWLVLATISAALGACAARSLGAPARLRVWGFTVPWDAKSSDDANAEIEACERRALVRSVLARLDPREREAVGLRFAGDLSQSEIARRMNISQSQASRVLGRALEKVRRELEGDAT